LAASDSGRYTKNIMRQLRIKTLNTYNDWLDKAKYEHSKYKESWSIYDLTNCLLTLNALPEWIKNCKSAPENLKSLASEKITIMQANLGTPYLSL
jgi:hypothetical protein